MIILLVQFTYGFASIGKIDQAAFAQDILEIYHKQTVVIHHSQLSSQAQKEIHPIYNSIYFLSRLTQSINALLINQVKLNHLESNITL